MAQASTDAMFEQLDRQRMLLSAARVLDPELDAACQPRRERIQPIETSLGNVAVGIFRRRAAGGSLIEVCGLAWWDNAPQGGLIMQVHKANLNQEGRSTTVAGLPTCQTERCRTYEIGKWGVQVRDPFSGMINTELANEPGVVRDADQYLQGMRSGDYASDAAVAPSSTPEDLATVFGAGVVHIIADQALREGLALVGADIY